MVFETGSGYDTIDPHVHEFIATLDYEQPVTGADVQDAYRDIGLDTDNPFDRLDPDQEYRNQAELVQDLLDQ